MGNFRIGVYGEQFIPTLALPELPTALSAAELMLNHPTFAAIGRHRIREAFRKVGVQMLAVLNNDDFLAMESTGVRSLTAYAMTEAWDSYKTHTLGRRYLLEHGIASSTATLAVEMWGSRAVDVIRSDPYVLLAIADWAEIDTAATRYFGVALDCSRRIRGCCESICNMAVARRKAAVPLEEFEKSFRMRMGADHSPEDALAACSADHTVRLVQAHGTQFVQGAGMIEIEGSLRHYVMSVLNRRTELGPLPQPISSDNHLAKLSESEHRFFEALASTHLATVEAPGASGVIAAQTVAKCFPKAIHIAPTGALFGGIGKLRLDWYPLREFIDGESLPPSVNAATVVIHDSASIDLLLANKLLRSVQQANRLIFIGDRHLSPSSGPGNIFAALMSEPEVVHEDITAIIGERKRTPPFVQIPTILSQSVRPADLRLKGLQVVQVKTRAELVGSSLKSYRTVFENSPHDGLVVTSTRDLATEINLRMHDEVTEYLAASEPNPPLLTLRNKQGATVGDMVIFLGRDYRRGLFPGSRGLVVQINAAERFTRSRHSTAMARILFDTAGYVDVTRQECELMSLGHAVQVQHVALSRWKKVIAAMEPSKNLNHSWCWYALTRADAEIVVLGFEGTFESALQRREAHSQYVPTLNLGTK